MPKYRRSGRCDEDTFYGPCHLPVLTWRQIKHHFNHVTSVFRISSPDRVMTVHRRQEELCSSWWRQTVRLRMIPSANEVYPTTPILQEHHMSEQQLAMLWQQPSGRPTGYSIFSVRAAQQLGMRGTLPFLRPSSQNFSSCHRGFVSAATKTWRGGAREQLCL